MQPLPPQTVASVFTTAADRFSSAAADLRAPAAGRLLAEGGRSMFQGLPTLRMTMPRGDDKARFLQRVEQAGEAALQLSSKLPTGAAELAAAQEAVRGWSTLAIDASMADSRTA